MTPFDPLGRRRALVDDAVEMPWLTDETLFSWCSRYHVFSVNVHDRQTRRQIFGDRAWTTAHDFPSAIDAFVRRTEGSLGSAEEIIRERTLLAYFLPWRSEAQGRSAIESMRDGTGKSLKWRLGLLTSSFGASHPLKACHACVTEDGAAAGRRHWRTHDQWPGVWWCLRHDKPLLMLNFPVDYRRRYAWTLPNVASLASPWTRRPRWGFRQGVDQRLARMAQFTAAAVAQPAGSLSDASLLARTYRLRLVELGCVKGPERIAWRAVSSTLFERFAPLEALPELMQSEASPAFQDRYGGLLTPRGGHTHPMRHLQMIEALFTDWGDFLRLKRMAMAEPPAPRPDAAPARKLSLAERLLPQAPTGVSATALSSVLRVSKQVALEIQTLQGVDMQRRPSRLTPELRAFVVARLRRGDTPAEVALETGLSVTTIYRVLTVEGGLKWTWRAAREDRHRLQARAAWELALKVVGGQSVNLARAIESATYAWLYRNDREWLRQSIARRREPPTRSNYANRRMQYVDQRLAARVDECAHMVAQAGCHYISEVIRATPGLLRRLDRLDRLPLTQGRLAEVQKRFETLRR